MIRKNEDGVPEINRDLLKAELKVLSGLQYQTVDIRQSIEFFEFMVAWLHKHNFISITLEQIQSALEEEKRTSFTKRMESWVAAFDAMAEEATW